MLITILIFLAWVFILVVMTLASPQRPKTIEDENGSRSLGSISEKIHVQINGVQQGMFIESREITNPVLLFLHGGPGMPEHFLTHKHPTGLEEHFTVCWWERRGAGLSYSAEISPETMTVEQMISDTLEVTNYLRRRFGKEKAYLMAHSGGTFFGIQAVARAPELYHAYIGVAQMSYQLKSEMLAYEYMLKQFKDKGNTRMVRKLERDPPVMRAPLPESYMALRDKAMHSLGIGTTHAMRSVFFGIFLPVWTDRDYTLRERANIWRGKRFSSGLLWNEMIATDLTKQVTELALPIYICSGKFDYTVSFTETKSYFDELKAPIKGFYVFERSAHSPMFEEPEKMLSILREDVLAGENKLADAK